MDYVFIDEEFQEKTKEILKNKILVTNDYNNNLHMINTDLNNDSCILDYEPIVDLIIVSNNKRSINQARYLIDKHTIISKVLSDDIFYIEDTYKDIRILVMGDKTIILKGHSIDTQLLHLSDIINT